MIIFKEIAQNFRPEMLGQEVFDYLKLITYNDVAFKSGFFSENELDRLKFRPCGLTRDYSTARKKMVLGCFLLIKILATKVLGIPYLYIKEFPIQPQKRL